MAITAGLNDVFDELFDETPTLKWSYFGSDEGSFKVYPASERDSCDNYDPRFRPWYVAAATPEPKDIVVVIDTSGSMDTSPLSRMDAAKEAAKVVLSTVNPRDYVGVVSFNSFASTSFGCYFSNLAQATPDNVNDLKQYVDTLSPGGGTAYIQAFTKAFDLLDAGRESGTTSGGTQAILFLTDGEPVRFQEHAIFEAAVAAMRACGQCLCMRYLT